MYSRAQTRYGHPVRKGRASFTALCVASARSLASQTRAALCDPHDRLAERFLPAPATRALELVHGTALGRGFLARGVARLSLGMVDHLALRSAIIDRRLGRELERGLPQLVIVGAGFDTRAYRLPELGATRVFEVDHPDSQRAKRERAEGLPHVAQQLDYAAVDLASGNVSDALAAAGHVPEARSFFLLEGLVPYLDRATLLRVLADLRRVSATGSVVLITYVTPELVVLRHGGGVVQAALQLIGEPMQNLLAPSDLAAELAAHGFTLEEDSDTRDWAAELAPDAQRQPLIAYERMALARMTRG